MNRPIKENGWPPIAPQRERCECEVGGLLGPNSAGGMQCWNRGTRSLWWEDGETYRVCESCQRELADGNPRVRPRRWVYAQPAARLPWWRRIFGRRG
jgi:hypothetical protein